MKTIKVWILMAMVFLSGGLVFGEVEISEANCTANGNTLFTGLSGKVVGEATLQCETAAYKADWWCQGDWHDCDDSNDIDHSFCNENTYYGIECSGVGYTIVFDEDCSGGDCGVNQNVSFQTADCAASVYCKNDYSYPGKCFQTDFAFDINNCGHNDGGSASCIIDERESVKYCDDSDGGCCKLAGKVCVDGVCVASAGCVDGTCNGTSICKGGVWASHCGDGEINCEEACDKNGNIGCAAGEFCKADCSACVTPCTPNDCSGVVVSAPCFCGGVTANAGDFCCAADLTDTYAYGAQDACQVSCGSTCTVDQTTEITGGASGNCNTVDSPCEKASNVSPGIKVKMRNPTEKVFLIDPTGKSYFLGQPTYAQQTKGNKESNCVIGTWTLTLKGTTCKVDIDSTGTCPFCGDGNIDPGETCDTNGNVGCSGATPICDMGCEECVAGTEPPPPAPVPASCPGSLSCTTIIVPADIGCSCGTAIATASNVGDHCCSMNNTFYETLTACNASPCGGGPTCDPPGASCTPGSCCAPNTCVGSVCTAPGVPISTHGNGLVPCGKTYDNPDTTWVETEDCDLCKMVLMGQLVIEFLLKIAAVAAILAIAFGGILYIFAAGNTGTIDKAKAIIKYALIGFLIIFISWAIVDTVLVMFGYIDPIGGDWYTINCY